MFYGVENFQANFLSPHPVEGSLVREHREVRRDRAAFHVTTESLVLARDLK